MRPWVKLATLHACHEASPSKGLARVSVILKVPLEEGSDEFIEVEVDEGTLLARGGSRNATFNLSGSWDRILPAVRMIFGKFRHLDVAPQEVSLEIGLKVGGETGLVVAKANAEALYRLTLTWRSGG